MTAYAVTNPATGQVVRTYETSTDTYIDAALDSAHDAFLNWGRTTAVSERVLLLRRAADLLRERQDLLAASIVEEMGKPIESARGEVRFSASILDYYADNAEELLADEPLKPTAGSAVIRREPLGAILGIMPWNFPVYQVARFAAPNLAAGNTVLLKHAPQCPQTAEELQRVFDDAGFPSGAYVNVMATNEQVAAIIADPRVRGVSLTGSERAGAAVAQIAGRHLKKVVLELGGSDPFLVLSTDDLSGTVDAAIEARMSNTGQACNAGKRIIVVDDLYDEFLALFTERMLAIRPAPMSSSTAAENLELQVASAVERGATLHTDGSRDGARFAPAVLTSIDRGSQAFHEELFGPVAMVFRVANEEEAIAVANDTPYGLGSYVFTTDPVQAGRVAEQIAAGMVFINCVNADAPELPFGGIKNSGFGRELGRYGIEEFLNRKLIRRM